MLEPVDVASVPQLNGIFAPTLHEADAESLEVVQGAVPRDLNGIYLRNGPNARFTPVGSYLYPLDGDGMVHGLWFENGAVRYRNRFVRTPCLLAEEAAGHALWPGVMDWDPPAEPVVGPELAGTDKDLPDVNVIEHAGRWLALAEGARAFELDRELATVGPYFFDGALPKGLTAHPKLDPSTGELVVFRYGFDDPLLSWAVVGADGAIATPEQAIEIDGTYMIHDCAITEHHLVLLVAPCLFDLEAAFRGEPVLSWRPERGLRIAVVPRKDATAPVQWFETDAIWVWHIANAFEDTIDGTTTIAVDFPHWNHPGMGLSQEASAGGVMRLRLDLTAGTVATHTYDDLLIEFPRIDARRLGLPYRWFVATGKDPAFHPEVPGEWNQLTQYDMTTGTAVTRPMGATMLGEPLFAPRDGATEEGDGYVLTYAYDTRTLDTTLLILPADDITGPPAATLRFPHRVPLGLHGSWISAS